MCKSSSTRLSTEPEPWKPSFWGLLSFGWADRPVGMARRQEPIGVKDLYIPTQQGAEECYKEFAAEWEAKLKSGKSRPLLRTLFSLYGKRFFVGGLFKIIWSIFVIVGAFYFVRSCVPPSLVCLGACSVAADAAAVRFDAVRCARSMSLPAQHRCILQSVVLIHMRSRASGCCTC